KAFDPAIKLLSKPRAGVLLWDRAVQQLTDIRPRAERLRANTSKEDRTCVRGLDFIERATDGPQHLIVQGIERLLAVDDNDGEFVAPSQLDEHQRNLLEERRRPRSWIVMTRLSLAG